MNFFGSSFDDPRTQGILAAAAALLGNRGSLSEGLSRGLLSGMVGFNQGQRNQREAQLEKLRNDMLQEQFTQQRTDKDLLQDFSVPRFPVGASVMKPGSMDQGPLPFDPREFVARGGSPQMAATLAGLQPRAPELMKVNTNERLIDPRTRQVVVDAQEEQWEPVPGLLPNGQLAMRNKRTGEVKAVGSGPLVQNNVGGYQSPLKVDTPAGPRFVLPPSKPGGQPTVLEIPGVGPAIPPRDKLRPEMPMSAVTQQNELLDQVNNATRMEQSLSGFVQQIDSGQLNFGAWRNLMNTGANWLGRGDKESVAYSNFVSEMKRLRNESLRLNKGAQTDGDAQREWEALFENLNNPEVVKTRLKAIANYNRQAAQEKMQQIELIRSNFGITEPLQSTPSAPAGGGFRFLGKE